LPSSQKKKHFMKNQKNDAADVIKPVFTEKQVLAGKNVTLICNYTGNVQSLQWYRQYPGSKPEHLIVFFETKPALRLTAAADKAAKSMTLTISSTEVKDSAMYYCALVPTVAGNTATLYKNLFLVYYIIMLIGERSFFPCRVSFPTFLAFAVGP
uniref:Ig-like domain-containing protein n=1 Tax=Cyprinus carpio TaxID=7962 RepID=A0A8C1YA88_CYPCA